MENDVLKKKLESLRRCIQRLTDKRPNTVSELLNNYDLQDIISINLERAVQISVDIGAYLLAQENIKVPETMGEVFTALSAENIIKGDLAERMRKAVGFRNISVHEYENVDWNIVFSIITNNLEDFKSFMKAALMFLF
ncbi:MAG: DUF86 domain-containing protein [Spirochaetales bacterium]|nr:DUF86 domain-containing protein [Spirochaetales bacterium]